MHYYKLWFSLGLSIATFMGSSMLLETARADEMQVCATRVDQEQAKELKFSSERVELFHYRNAENLVKILNQLPVGDEPGCASRLAQLPLAAGTSVGSGGGNILVLNGTQEYIEQTKRLVTALDLPLPGINLQMWGVQISSKSPKKLAKTMIEVRADIDLTQELVRETLLLLQQFSQETLRNETLIDPDFKDIVRDIGYEAALDGSGSQSLLEIGLVGTFVKNPLDFYNRLHKRLMRIMRNNDDQRYKKYIELMDQERRPPFERFFRSRGLKPESKNCDRETSQSKKKVIECLWEWKEIIPGKDKPYSSTELVASADRKALLDFAFHYADFRNNPEHFNSEKLRSSADILNSILQSKSGDFQKDIDDLFTRPTLRSIQNIVAEDRKVSFAQVGRTTVATLNGVSTTVNSKSISAFRIPQTPTFQQLVQSAQMLNDNITNFIPTEAVVPGGAEAAQISVGPLPLSQLIGLVIAFSEEQSRPVEIATTNRLTFTPGILRNLSSAELNIKLELADPLFNDTTVGEGEEATQVSDQAVEISRLNKQTINTSVYTQALDFFELSAFTSQATVKRERGYFPVIGRVWNAIFSGIPGLGDLFSYSRGNQNILHERLILTNSFITPTPLGLGLLYSQNNSLYKGVQFCKTEERLQEYYESRINVSKENNFTIEPVQVKGVTAGFEPGQIKNVTAEVEDNKTCPRKEN